MLKRGKSERNEKAQKVTIVRQLLAEKIHVHSGTLFARRWTNVADFI